MNVKELKRENKSLREELEAAYRLLNNFKALYKAEFNARISAQNQYTSLIKNQLTQALKSYGEWYDK